MKPGDVQHIPPLVAHSFTGLTDSVFFEFSTTDKAEDSYRITTSEKIPEEEFKEILEKHGTE